MIISLFGILALLLFMPAYWFCTEAFFSVWCFFASLLSVVIYLHVKFEMSVLLVTTQTGCYIKSNIDTLQGWPVNLDEGV
jgi:hypothetical protein